MGQRSVGLKDAGPLLFMKLELSAWLSRGEWHMTVDGDEFQGWAAYSGIDLRPVQGSFAFIVVLKNEEDEALFRSRWMCAD